MSCWAVDRSTRERERRKRAGAAAVLAFPRMRWSVGRARSLSGGLQGQLARTNVAERPV